MRGPAKHKGSVDEVCLKACLQNSDDLHTVLEMLDICHNNCLMAHHFTSTTKYTTTTQGLKSTSMRTKSQSIPPGGDVSTKEDFSTEVESTVSPNYGPNSNLKHINLNNASYSEVTSPTKDLTTPAFISNSPLIRVSNLSIPTTSEPIDETEEATTLISNSSHQAIVHTTPKFDDMTLTRKGPIISIEYAHQSSESVKSIVNNPKSEILGSSTTIAIPTSTSLQPTDITEADTNSISITKSTSQLKGYTAPT